MLLLVKDVFGNFIFFRLALFKTIQGNIQDLSILPLNSAGKSYK